MLGGLLRVHIDLVERRRRVEKPTDGWRVKSYIATGKVFRPGPRSAHHNLAIHRQTSRHTQLASMACHLLSMKVSRTSAQRSPRRLQNAETSASHSCRAVACTLRPCRRSTPTGPVCRKLACGSPTCRPAGRRPRRPSNSPPPPDGVRNVARLIEESSIPTAPALRQVRTPKCANFSNRLTTSPAALDPSAAVPCRKDQENLASRARPPRGGPLGMTDPRSVDFSTRGHGPSGPQLGRGIRS